MAVGILVLVISCGAIAAGWGYDPQQAYLHVHTPRIGYALIAGGVIGALASVAAMLA